MKLFCKALTAIFEDKISCYLQSPHVEDGKLIIKTAVIIMLQSGKASEQAKIFWIYYDKEEKESLFIFLF